MKKFIIGIVICFFAIGSEPIKKYNNFESVLLTRNRTACTSLDNYSQWLNSLKTPPSEEEDEARKNQYSCYTIPKREYLVLQIYTERAHKLDAYYAWLFVTQGNFESKSEEVKKSKGLTLVVMISGEEAKGIK